MSVILSSLILITVVHRTYSQCINIDPNCDSIESFTSTIAIQIFDDNDFNQTSFSYSYLSLSINATISNPFSIITHCISTLNPIYITNNNVTELSVHEYLSNYKPWPKYHEIGNIININNSDILIEFNNPCQFISNISYQNAIILVFNNNPFQYKIKKKCDENEYKSIAIFDTLRSDLSSNCSSLPIIQSSTSWNLQLLSLKSYKFYI